ncbi:hypothetical protein MYAM1_001689 [Malassezia yamatoensis]|uniref:Xylanolytic transcriptional activator regulatory domain-containing protein n=1 Tax=Malassezia yamatoensis TaxID=253288 RepID=A0AAJ5YSB2_9BASI|nr:hypothetical protein MYAM1_001689 [Malassezia yamatoensis]
MPCGPCRRHGISSECSYEKRTRNPNSAPHPNGATNLGSNGDQDEIRQRLEYLEALVTQSKRSGDANLSRIPADALGNVPDQPLQVLGRPKADPCKIDPDAEDAALVLEGLTMDSTMSFNQHRGRQVMRRAIDQSQTPLSPEARKELENEGVLDPMANFITEGHHAALARCHATRDDESTSQQIEPEVPLQSACRNQTILRLKSNTESSLGWGMGWALAASSEMNNISQIENMVSKDYQSHTSGVRSNERVAVLHAIVCTLPSLKQCELLLDVFERRAQPFVLNIIHVQSLRRELRLFFALDKQKCRATVVEMADPCWLGVLLLVLVIGLSFREADDVQLNQDLGQFTDPGFQSAWYSAAKTCLVLSGYVGSQSVAVLTTILLLLFQIPCTASQSPGLLRVAISNAQGMGLHRLGDYSNRMKKDVSVDYRIRQELGKRIWWALVVSDWQNALMSTTPYMIQAHQFNTPLPGNFNGEDLLVSSSEPHPLDVMTEMSFALSSIELAKVMREQAELVSRIEMEQMVDGEPRHMSCEQAHELDRKYHAVLNNAPIFSSKVIGNQSEELIAVQKWAFQQNVFIRLLQIHRIALSKKQARLCVVDKARHILAMQREIRSRSDLVDKLVQNILQSFSAATLLCLDLLYTPPTAIQRETIRSEISVGLEGISRALKQVGMTPRGIRIIRALLDEEEKRWKELNSRDKNDETPQSRTHLLHMALRVARLTRESEKPTENCSEQSTEHKWEPVATQKPNSEPLQQETISETFNAFPPLQPTLTSFDPYQMGSDGIKVNMMQDLPSSSDLELNLQSFLDNLNGVGLDSNMNSIPMEQDFSEVPPSNLPSFSNPEPSQPYAIGMSTNFTDASAQQLDSDSPSTQSGSGSARTSNESPSEQNLPVMDGFWDWVFTQGTQADWSKPPNLALDLPSLVGLNAPP